MDQVIQQVRARLNVARSMRCALSKQVNTRLVDFGEPLYQRIRGLSLSELTKLCQLGTVFDNECAKAALAISGHKKMKAAQVRLLAWLHTLQPVHERAVHG